MEGLTAALLMYCFAACVANVAMGISGFGSGIIMVLGWQVANMLALEGTVPFEHTQVMLVAMALPTSTFLTCRSWQGNSIDLPVCLTFGVTNLSCYVGGLLLLLHVLLQSPALLKHALGILFLVFALLRIASDCKLIPGSGVSPHAFVRRVRTSRSSVSDSRLGSEHRDATTRSASPDANAGLGDHRGALRRHVGHLWGRWPADKCAISHILGQFEALVRIH